jgi:predicted NBD/HSP70 family sugar kinase
MYLAVDIGGTKTLLAAFDEGGKATKEIKFPTPKNYQDFLAELEIKTKELGVEDFRAACVAAPAKIDHEHGNIIAGGNITWHHEALQADIEKLVNAPVVIENDAKLAGLSKAILIKKEFKRVLYITISTGIGTALIVDGVIDPIMEDMEGGQIMLEYQGKIQKWESFASGKAIKARYGKIASEIDDTTTWKEIVRAFAVGLVDLLAIIQPEVVIIGGGVGTHFDKYGKLLETELKKYQTPLVPIPPIRAAQRPEEAVIYGCYELVKETYGSPVTAA